MNSFDSSFVEDGKVNMTRISDYHDQVNPQLLTAYLTFSLAYSASNPLLFDKDVQVLVEPMVLGSLLYSQEGNNSRYISHCIHGLFSLPFESF